MTQDLDFGAGSDGGSEPVPARPGGNLPETTVSELAHALKRTIEGAFGQVRVRGEIGKITTPRSGHIYLTLKDADACLESVVWRSTAARLGLVPEQGMEVVCTGRLTTYGQRSQYQLVIERMELAGEGALLKLLEERRRRLAAEGLFDEARKRPLPFLPQVIGVVTSPTGAVIRDILHRLADRFPRHVLVWPVLVQGEGAAAQVAAAIDGFNALPEAGAVPRPDLLIVARGGGSLEDLMPFNEEIVVRAAAASRIPLISAVGHETDTTLIDFAADQRAPTPTAAAEMAVPVRAELMARVADAGARLTGGTVRLLRDGRTRTEDLGRALGGPARLLEAVSQRLDDRSDRLDQCAAVMIERRRARVAELAAALPPPRVQLQAAARHLDQSAARLAAAARSATIPARQRFASAAERLSPAPLIRLAADAGRRLEAAARLLATLHPDAPLARGYAIVFDLEGKPLTSAATVTGAGRATLHLHDGDVPITVDRQGRLL